MCGAGLHPVTCFTRGFIFLGFFLYIRNTYFSGTPEIRCPAGIYSQCVNQEFTLFFLFLQIIRRPVLASYKLVTFNSD